jgi:osmotically-inducible protein OsmY
VAALIVSATQLAGCFPVLAGAVGTGVVMATDRRPTGTQTIDRGLQMEIDSTLSSRFSGDKARVEAAVFNRKVLLVGEVSNADVKQQVEQYVRGLQNTRDVVNELQVTASPGFMTRSNDAYLTSKVKTLMVTAEGVPANSIKVTTDKSVVYLLGIVTNAEGDKATDVARNPAACRRWSRRSTTSANPSVPVWMHWAARRTATPAAKRWVRRRRSSRCRVAHLMRP